MTSPTHPKKKLSAKQNNAGIGALALILVCFGASGLARLSDVAPQLPNAWELVSTSAMAQAARLSSDGGQGIGHDPSLPGAESVAAEAMQALTAEPMKQPAPWKPVIAPGALPSDDAAIAPRQGMAAYDPEMVATATSHTPSLADRLARLNPENVDDQSADLLETLRGRERELSAIAEELERRRLAIEAASRRMEERLGDLERAKEELATLVASIDKAAARDVEHLIAMYQKMKPKEAGAVFNTMGAAFASGFISRMKPDKAAAIMAKMTPEKAYAVSAHLAGRNVRTESNSPF